MGFIHYTKEEFNNLCREEGVVNQRVVNALWDTRPSDILHTETLRKTLQKCIKSGLIPREGLYESKED